MLMFSIIGYEGFCMDNPETSRGIVIRLNDKIQNSTKSWTGTMPRDAEVSVQDVDEGLQGRQELNIGINCTNPPGLYHSRFDIGEHWFKYLIEHDLSKYENKYEYAASRRWEEEFEEEFIADVVGIYDAKYLGDIVLPPVEGIEPVANVSINSTPSPISFSTPEGIFFVRVIEMKSDAAAQAYFEFYINSTGSCFDELNTIYKKYDYANESAVFSWYSNNFVIIVTSDNAVSRPQAIIDEYLKKYPSDVTAPEIQRYPTAINLEGNLNLISIPVIPENATFDSLFAGIQDIETVYYYDAGADDWLAWHLNKSIPSSEGFIQEPVKAYWVKMKQNTTATLNVNGTPGIVLPTGIQIPPTLNVYKGWNLIGVHRLAQTTPADYLNWSAVKYAAVWGYNPKTQNLEHIPISTGVMEPGRGYWVYFLEDGVIAP